MAFFGPVRQSVPSPPRVRAGRHAIVVALAGAILLAFGSASPAAAHAALDASDPAPGAVLPIAPSRVSLRFTEPLERSFSKAELYDQTGNLVPDATSRAGADDFAMLVDLPPGLPNGTYSVLWQTLSAADGHTGQGYFAFTIGAEADVQTVVPPPAIATDGPSDSVRAASRWLALLGLAAAVAVLPVWLFVLRPAIAPAWPAGPAIARRVRELAIGAVGLAIVGSVGALLVQAATIGGASGLGDSVATTLRETRYGTLWLIRVGLFLVYAVALVGVDWWRPRRRRWGVIGALALGALLPLPFSLVAHAAAQPAGRVTAVAFDALHLLAASLWVGGLLVLVGALAPELRDLTPESRRLVLRRVIPRFSTLALIAWGVMGMTGLYGAWLNVGNLEALRTTPYGRSLILKLALLVPLLALGAFNLLVVTRRLRLAGTDGASRLWSRRFVAAIAGEAVLVVLLFFVVGRLTAQPPARDALALNDGRLTIPFEADGRNATLFVTPGATGPNHYRLELGSGHDLSSTSEPARAMLRIDRPDRDVGRTEIALTQAAGNAFEGHGTELSIAGDWRIEVVFRQIGVGDWTATTIQAIATTPPAVDLPAPPPRIGAAGLGGLLLLVAGLAGLVVAWRAGPAPLRRKTAGLGAAALVLGALVLVQARVPSGADERGGESVALAAEDSAAIVRGGALFAANCVACHGTGGKGDGPAAAGLNPPVADLTATHARAHGDESLTFYIENGIAGSAMPAFGDTLADADVQDVISYLRSVQRRSGGVAEVPAPEACQIAPRPLESLRPDALLAATPATATTPAAGPEQPADVVTVAGITATVREVFACVNAGDVPRRLSLFSDAYVRRSFPGGASEAYLTLIGRPPIPAAPDQRTALFAIRDVRVLPDGRISALVTFHNPADHSHGPPGTPAATEGSDQQTVRFIFVRAGDRWLIDEFR